MMNTQPPHADTWNKIIDSEQVNKINAISIATTSKTIKNVQVVDQTQIENRTSKKNGQIKRWRWS